MPKQQFKRTCECQKCGNEAEMVITCSLPEHQQGDSDLRVVPEQEGQFKGQAVCTRCGSEADIWLTGITSP